MDAEVVIFMWDKSDDWDGMGTWDGMIKPGELVGTAYAADGSVLYSLVWLHDPNGLDSYKWIAAK